MYFLKQILFLFCQKNNEVENLFYDILKHTYIIVFKSIIIIK